MMLPWPGADIDANVVVAAAAAAVAAVVAAALIRSLIGSSAELSWP